MGLKGILDFVSAVKLTYLDLTKERRTAKKLLCEAKVILEHYRSRYELLKETYDLLYDSYLNMPIPVRVDYYQKTLDLFKYGVGKSKNTEAYEVRDSLDTHNLGMIELYGRLVEDIEYVYNDMKTAYKVRKYESVTTMNNEIRERIDKFFYKYGISPIGYNNLVDMQTKFDKLDNDNGGQKES